MRLNRFRDQIDTLIKEWGPHHEIRIFDNLRGEFSEVEIMGMSEFDPDERDQNDFLVMHSKTTLVDEILDDENRISGESET